MNVWLCEPCVPRWDSSCVCMVGGGSTRGIVLDWVENLTDTTGLGKWGPLRDLYSCGHGPRPDGFRTLVSTFARHRSRAGPRCCEPEISPQGRPDAPGMSKSRAGGPWREVPGPEAPRPPTLRPRSTTMRSQDTLFLALALGLGGGPGLLAQGRGQRPDVPTGQEPAEESPEEPPAPDFGTPRLEGVPGTVAPQPVQILSEDRPVHPPGEGVAAHALLEIAESDGAGLLLTWRDTRDGVPGIRFGRLSSRVKLREPERRVTAGSLSGPESAPVPVLGAGGHMLLLRVERASEGPVLRVRPFGPDGSRLEEFELGAVGPGSNPPRPRNPRSPRKNEPRQTPRSGPPRSPVGALDPFGGGLVAWRQGSVAQLQRLSDPTTLDGPSLAVPLVDPGDPRWADAEIGALRLRRAPSGRALLGWSCNGTVHLLGIPREGTPRTAEVGPGDLLGIHCSDGSGIPGWWLELEVEGRRILRPLDRGLAPSGADLFLPEDLRSLAVWSGGLALLLGESPWVHGYSWKGKPTAKEALPVLVEGTENPEGIQLASSGSHLFALWTDTGDGRRELYGRSLEKWGVGWGPVARIPTDAGTGDQELPDVATDGQRRALAVWVDQGRVRGRPWRVPGSINAPLFELPRPFVGRDSGVEPVPGTSIPAGEFGTRPRIAMDSGGHALAVWLTRPSEGGPFRVATQLLDAEGQSLGPARALDHPGIDAPGSFPPAVAAFQAGRGFATLWVRDSGEVVVRHVNRQGELAPREHVLDRGLTPRNPSLVQLDDLRWIAAWDDGPTVGGRSIRACFLGSDLRPVGTAFVIEQLDTGVDARPSLARAANGGFAMAWVSGAGPDRDVFARSFDAGGRANTKPMPLTTAAGAQDHPHMIRNRDGSWAVAWEDNLSGSVQICLRRLDGQSLLPGPVVALHQQAAAVNPDCGQPRLATMGPALLGVWVDHRLSQGHDVFQRLLGEGFDGIEVDPAPIETDSGDGETR